ncbi:MAG TPA: M1 family metallopeptidase [Flavobacteriales bacterium]|jgi:predicted secreted protein|nr:M1 family metallopeptidase [Flavobacteriales bacterium]MBK6549014.1 M1 family metallopeptidase [Flavobacteriales bacterium]MBK7100790.1 M1 family metallopeptidase [Flavobacteriales bacterium]MBK7111477.1 M1 family metallopeptidase [Flavobacteriales bacterium]MBK7618342.1 M1 family metallopeptidase [Flavobacteriales bacterium]
MAFKYSLAAFACLVTCIVSAQDSPRYGRDKFRQLDQELPTPNEQRTASGAPGHAYWQMKADYDIKVEIDDPSTGSGQTPKLTGTETITYHNQSPDKLEYLWLQLDGNIYEPGSDANLIRTGTIGDSVGLKTLRGWLEPFDGGFRITSVTDASGNKLKHTINRTMMRIDLPKPLASGAVYSFKIGWWFPINDRMKVGGRSGYEYFEEEDNYLYTVAQFYPRMCAYMDYSGWMHKQFLGSGEFTLDFGDYDLSITVPSDHIVGATGVLQNESAVLSGEQRSRLAKARSADKPVMIVTPEEAANAEKTKAGGKKTWVFKAQNVRDVAFASSRKFIWDGQNQPVGKHNVLCMSYYPKEGNPLWEQYSTKVVAHTIKTYSKYTCDYIYPVAISVHTDRIGMEYPMICFNGGRPEKDGTYSERTKYGMIGVIIHEVGHNFFPMIINSDERQWTWMDEGLNTFTQYLTEQEWDRDYPSWRGKPRNIVDYMKGDPSTGSGSATSARSKARIEPIMTNSESITQFGNNAYGKPCTALNILRETVMGRELFDHAFKTYAERWKFKHPTPADFFRTMEDASGVDLDWFWRGWFYTTDHVDLALSDLKYKRMDPRDPGLTEQLKRQDKDHQVADLSRERNIENKVAFVVDRDPAAQDFYNSYDPLTATDRDRAEYEQWKKGLEPEELALLNADIHLYELQFKNIGGLVMPVILEWEYTDGSKEVDRIPAEIWKTSDEVSKVFVKRKEVKSVTLDPFLETADCDLNNNSWPPRMIPTRFDIYKEREREHPNPMQMERMKKEVGVEMKGE